MVLILHFCAWDTQGHVGALLWLVLYVYSLTSGSRGKTDALASTDLHENESNWPNPMGHMRPLGQHQPAEGLVEEVSYGFVHPWKFYNSYVFKSKPVIFKGAARSLIGFSQWKDDTLRNVYGTEMFEVEYGKKENRSLPMRTMTLAEFLNLYKREDIYLVGDLVKSMQNDVELPSVLHCGGFQKLLQTSVLWMSSGNTKSVLHMDEYENINCLLDGTKRVILIDKEFDSELRSMDFVHEGSYSTLDVEEVDMHKYPHMQQMPWWSGHLQKGDCIYIPIGWYHSVWSGMGRNLAINVWFAKLLWFNTTDCDNQSTRKGPISNYLKASNEVIPEKIRSEIFEPFQGLSLVTMDDAVEVWGEENEVSIEEIEEVFTFLDSNADSYISWDEIYSADVDEILSSYAYILPPEYFMDQENDEYATHQDDSGNHNGYYQDNDKWIGEKLHEEL